MVEIRSSWSWPFILLILVAVVFVVLVGLVLGGINALEVYSFNPVTTQSIVDLLVPLFVISLFLERALEVFISSWRDLKATELSLKAAERCATTRTLSGLHPPEVATDRQADPALMLAAHKAETKRYALLAGITVGVLISVAGVRTLRPLIDWDAEIVGGQSVLFNALDILLTGALIGGGAEGIHRVLSVIMDFLDMTRRKIAAATPSVK